MCARQLQKHSDDVRKAERPDVDEVVSDDSVDDASAMRVLRANLTWREWLVRDFLRYWYWLAMLVIDVFVPWSAADAFGLWEGYRAIIVLFFVVALVVAEVELYLFLWPEGLWKGGHGRRRRRFAKGSGMIDRLLGRDDD